MSLTDERNTSVEHLWNVTGRGKIEIFEENPITASFCVAKMQSGSGLTSAVTARLLSA